MFSFGDDQTGGFLGMLGKMFQQAPGNTVGMLNTPAQPTPDNSGDVFPGGRLDPTRSLPPITPPNIQQPTAQAQNDPSLMDKLQSGVNKNTDTMFGLAGGLLNQRPQSAMQMADARRASMPLSIAPQTSTLQGGGPPVNYRNPNAPQQAVQPQQDPLAGSPAWVRNYMQNLAAKQR